MTRATLCVAWPTGTLCVPPGVERQGRHSHAERENEGRKAQHHLPGGDGSKMLALHFEGEKMVLKELLKLVVSISFVLLTSCGGGVTEQPHYINKPTETHTATPARLPETPIVSSQTTPSVVQQPGTRAATPTNTSTTSTSTPPETPIPGIEATTTEGFRLYSISNDGSEVSVAKNEKVTLVANSDDGEWLLIERSDGKRGWGTRLHIAVDSDDSLNRLPSLPYTPPPITVGASSPSYRLTANGDAENIFALEMESLAIGTSELTYPAVMNLGEDAFVELMIRPATILASLSQFAPGIPPPPAEASEAAVSLLESMSGITNTLDYRTDYGREIRIFPVMYAELKASEDSFLIIAETESRRTVDPDAPVRWRWIVTPRTPGPRSLILTIYIPATVDGQLEILETRQLASFPIRVEVMVTPTPTATETPVATNTPIPTETPTLTPTPTFFDRSGESIAANFNTIVVAFIGLFGVIITIWKQIKKASSPPPSSPPPVDITTMLYEHALTRIKNTDDLTQLKAWLHDEKENPKKRPKVIAAIEKQIKEVQNSSKSES